MRGQGGFFFQDSPEARQLGFDARAFLLRDAIDAREECARISMSALGARSATKCQRAVQFVMDQCDELAVRFGAQLRKLRLRRIVWGQVLHGSKY